MSALQAVAMMVSKHIHLASHYNQNKISMLIEELFEESFIKQSVPQFIRKVYLILETNKYQDIICWDADNATIVIKDQDGLTDTVLSTVYKQHTLKSFIRQLNMYDFKKVKRTPDDPHLCFRNEHFKKGHLEGLVFIKRKQRGYVEKNKLENLQSKETLDRYNTYAFGILHKLKDQFSKLHPKFPDISNELNNMIMSNLNSKSLLSASEINQMSNNQMSMDDIMGENNEMAIPLFLSILSMPDFPEIPQDADHS